MELMCFPICLAIVGVIFGLIAISLSLKRIAVALEKLADIEPSAKK